MAHKPIMPKAATQPAAPRRRSNLPLIIVGGALLLIVVGMLVLLRPGGSAAGKPVDGAGKPKLAVDREQIDFGKVPLDKPVKAEFQLSNIGDQPLELVGIPVVEVKEGC